MTVLNANMHYLITVSITGQQRKTGLWMTVKRGETLSRMNAKSTRRDEMRLIDADELLKQLNIGPTCWQCKKNNGDPSCKGHVKWLCRTISSMPTIDPSKQSGTWVCVYQKRFYEG